MSEGFFCVNDLAAIGEPDENAFNYIDFYGDWHMGNWGYFDNTGKEVIKPQYFEAGDFRNGYAEVLKGKWDFTNDCVDGEHFLIDKTGKPLFPDKYDFIWRMEIAKNITSYGFSSDEKVHPDFIRVSHNGKSGIINYRGEWIVEPQFEMIHCDMSEDGCIIFCDEDFGEFEINALYGIYSIQEQRRLIEPKYREIEILGNGHFLVEEVIEEAEEGPDESVKKILDKTGKEVFPSYYYDIEPIDGVYIVTKWRNNEPNLKGIIDFSGNVILPCIYQAEKFFVNKQLIVIISDNGHFGLMSFDGDIIFPPVFSKIENIKNIFLLLEVYDPEDYSTIGKKGLCTFSGELILPLEYDKIDFYEDLIIAQNREGAIIFKVKKHG